MKPIKQAFSTIPYSEAEDVCLAGFHRFGLKPMRNYQVDYFYIDFAWPDQKIGLEIDSYKWHKDTNKDIYRHNYIEKKGWKLHHIMAKIVFANPTIAAAFMYLKYFNNDSELEKLARFEFYKLMRFYKTDLERQNAIKTFDIEAV